MFIELIIRVQNFHFLQNCLTTDAHISNQGRNTAPILTNQMANFFTATPELLNQSHSSTQRFNSDLVARSHSSQQIQSHWSPGSVCPYVHPVLTYLITPGLFCAGCAVASVTQASCRIYDHIHWSLWMTGDEPANAAFNNELLKQVSAIWPGLLLVIWLLKPSNIRLWFRLFRKTVACDSKPNGGEHDCFYNLLHGRSICVQSNIHE